MKASDSDAKSITDSLWWELLKIAIVPVMLTLFGALLNQKITQRERMQNYLTSTSDLATKTDSLGRMIEIKNNPAIRSLVRARTLLILSEINGSEKRQVMEFLANSDIHYQIPLSSADLSNADLSGMYLKHINLTNANLSGARLDGAKLMGASLFGITADRNTSLKDLVVDHCTILPSPKSISFTKKMDRSDASTSEKCRYNAKGEPLKAQR